MNANGWNIRFDGTRSEVHVYHSDPTVPPGTHPYRFVARFKYARPMANARHFVRFLVANFTPAEFFAAREDASQPPPAAVLRSKGYVSLNAARAARVAVP